MPVTSGKDVAKMFGDHEITVMREVVTSAVEEDDDSAMMENLIDIEESYLSTKYTDALNERSDEVSYHKASRYVIKTLSNICDGAFLRN